MCAGGGLGGGEWGGVLAHEELVGLLLGRNGLCQDHDAQGVYVASFPNCYVVSFPNHYVVGLEPFNVCILF